MKKYIVPKVESIDIDQELCLSISGTPANGDPAGAKMFRSPFGNSFGNPFGGFEYSLFEE